MHRTPSRRPSPALAVALLALFVALGGPAEAAKLIRGSQVKSSTLTGRHIKNSSLTTSDLKNGSLQIADLSRGAVGQLRSTPAGSVNSAAVVDGALTGVDIADRTIGLTDLAPNSVGPGKINTGAVGAAELGDNAVDSAAVLDGVLGAKDVARFADTFTADFGSIDPQSCKGLEPDGLAPQLASVDLAGDVILGTPPANWPDTLTFTIRRAPASANRIRIVACNPTAAAVAAASGLFRYAVLDLP